MIDALCEHTGSRGLLQVLVVHLHGYGYRHRPIRPSIGVAVLDSTL